VVCCCPRTPASASGARSGAESHQLALFVLLERFLFVLPEEDCFSLGQSAIRRRSRKAHASTMTYSGREEKGAPPIYRAGSFRPEALARVRRSKAVLAHIAILSLYWHRSPLSRQPTLTFRTKPSSSAFTRPVAIRQRSTARRRASATIAFLRAAAQVFGPSRTALQRRTAR
jgi:hypothetical protein